MATKYSTLTLEEEPRVERSRVKTFALVGLAVFAVAGVATFGLSGHRVESSVDAEFSVAKGSVAICEATDSGFLAALPKFDFNYANSDQQLGDACFQSYRCCSELDSSCGPASTMEACKGCLQRSPPKMVDNRCRLYAQKKIRAGPGSEIQCKKVSGKWSGPDARCALFNGEPAYTKKDVIKGKVPKPKAKYFTDEFRGLKTCWIQGGGSENSNARKSNSKKFANTCMGIVNLCTEGQLCPNAKAFSGESSSCKNCIATSGKIVRDSHMANLKQLQKDLKEQLARAKKEKAAQEQLDKEREEREKKIKGKQAK